MPTKRKQPERRRVLPDGLPFVPYVRVSDLNGRDPDADAYGTERTQRASVEATARKHELTLMPEPFPGAFTDRDVTGSHFDRAGWQRALALIETGAAAGIVAYNQARMSRARMGETLAMVAEVEKLGGRLYDENGPVEGEGIGEIVTALKAWQSRAEWEQRRRDRMTAVERAIGRGVHLAAPFGYAKGPDKRLVVDEAEAEQVRRAFELRAAGHSWPSIAEQLNRSGAAPRPYRRDGVVMRARWTHKTVRHLVRNRVYTGVAYNGDHETPEAHPAIVSPELFERAGRTRGTKPVGPDEGYLLPGLVRCSGCGYAMTHAPVGERRYYRCRPEQHGADRCPAPASVPAEALETHVVGEFERRFLIGEVTPDADERVLEAERRVTLCERRLAGSFAAKRELGRDATRTELRIADEQLDADRADLRDAEADLRELRAQVRGGDLPPAMDLAAFRSGLLAERRHCLSLVYACVVVRRARRWREPAAERASVLLRDEAPADLTGLIRHVAVLDV